MDEGRLAAPGPLPGREHASSSPEKLASVDSNLQMDDAAFQGLLDRVDEMRMLRRSPRLAQVSAITGTFVNVTGGMFTS